MNKNFQYIVKLLSKLPGVGPRQAGRFVLAMLEQHDTELKELGTAISTLKDTLHFCEQCYNISDNGALCGICSDARRDKSKILVVEKVSDLASFERTGLYRGLYHVLGGAINPAQGVNPEQLRINELRARITTASSGAPPTAGAGSSRVELILATNPSTTGDTTLLYLKDVFAHTPNITLTRLARGLASGSSVEFADEITLKHALESRK